MNRKNVDMLRGPLGINILYYALPIMFTSYLQLLFNAADLVVVGRFCGSVSVAAVGSTGAITNLIINLFIGLSVGSGVAVAHAIGSRESEAIHRTVHTSLLTAVIGGVLLTGVGITCSTGLLRMMSTPESVLPLASVYMRVYFGGILFTLVYNFCTSILRAAGDTRTPLVILTAAGVINVILNVVFVTMLNMNVAGVALATVISQALSAVAVVWVLMHRNDDCRLDVRQLRIHREQLLKIMRIGIPAGVQGAMFSISNVMIQSSVNSFGDTVVSGVAAVSNLESFCYSTVNAFHQTAVNYIGQNTGAGKLDRVKKIFRQCVLYAAVSGLIIGVLAWVFRVQLLGIYITDSAEAIAIGAARMTLTTLPYFIFGMMDTVTGALRGLGESFTSMILSILGICGVRLLWIGTVFQLPMFHTVNWLHVSYILSWVVTLVAQAIAYELAYRRMVRRSEAYAARQ